MKPDHRVLLGCALAWLCCAAVVVKSEDELLDGNALKEGNSVGSEWPERDESGVINILKQMYNDIQEMPFYEGGRNEEDDKDDETKDGKDSCETVCGLEEGKTSNDDLTCNDDGSITCECKGTKEKFHYEDKLCKDCDCGAFEESCEFDKTKNHSKVCTCKSEYEQILDECRSPKCKTDCGFPDSVETGVICDDSDADSDATCSCNVTENKFDDKSKTCKKCDCGIHTCSFKEGKEDCECSEGYEKTPDGKCKIPDSLCETTCGKASGVFCEPESTLQKVICSCMDPEKKKKYDRGTQTCKETCDGDKQCENGAKCEANVEGGEYKFCRCLKDTSGDFCKYITECGRSLIRCIGKNGKCTYNATTEKAYCECPPKHSFDDTIGYCESN